jgi:(E)-4-hydroxy-3-methylbut-2-enyl-diphosphate synthase
MLPRRQTRSISVGGVVIGGGAPVVVQAMTKTDTRDVRATVAQVRRLEMAGAEVVRLAVPDRAAADALRDIRKQVRPPLIADIHFDHRLALAALDAGVDGLRINPGNIGSRDKVRQVVRAAAERNAPIRIGVNSGSLEKDILAREGGVTAGAMVESALRHVRILEDLDFRLIKISLKASDIPRTVEAYRLLAGRVDYPFHAGITEAGRLLAGSVKSAAGLALLLAEGLADTIRVSLTAPAEKEVHVAWQVLQSLGVRARGVNFVSCPTCGRCEVDLLGLAARVEKAVLGLRAPLTVAVMGCTVNGPGEAREADIGLACGRGSGVIFKKGKILRRVSGGRMADEFIAEVLKLAAKEIREED